MKRILSYLSGAFALILLWQIVSVLTALPILPQPLLVAERWYSIFFSEIAVHGIYSLGRIAGGLLLSVAVGFPLGMLMGYVRKADRYLAPIVYLTYPIPKIALLPILMLLVGLGEMSKLLMIFLIVVFQVIISVRDGIHEIPKEIFEPLISLGASFYDVFREVLWPASLPKFLTALRVAMATAVSVLFFTETFGTQYGMGYFIMDAWLRVNYLDMYAGIMTLSAIGLLLFGIMDLIEYRACRWLGTMRK